MIKTVITTVILSTQDYKQKKEMKIRLQIIILHVLGAVSCMLFPISILVWVITGFSIPAWAADEIIKLKKK